MRQVGYAEEDIMATGLSGLIDDRVLRCPWTIMALAVEIVII